MTRGAVGRVGGGWGRGDYTTAANCKQKATKQEMLTASAVFAVCRWVFMKLFNPVPKALVGVA